jgi:uncharacterized RDD family membrane protein YckC
MDAGWYNDPFGRFTQRYHDGDEWTAHVSTGDGRSFSDPSGADALIGGPLPVSGDGGPLYASDASGRPADLASPWIRLAARLLDTVVVGLPAVILATVLIAPPVEVSEDATQITYDWASVALVLAISGGYETFMIGWRGQTLGKIATGIRVVRSRDRGQPGYGVAGLRWAAANFLSSLPYVGWLIGIASIVLIFADNRRQMIHDKIAQTMVVRA